MLSHHFGGKGRNSMKYSIAVLLTALSVTQASAITVETTNFISSPMFFNGFEGIGPLTTNHPNVQYGFDLTVPFNTPYSEGGITVNDVMISNDPNHTAVHVGWAQPAWHGDGNFNWYSVGLGYTDITLTNGGEFQSIQFLEGSGHLDNTNVVAYELLDHGVVVATGTLPDLTSCCTSTPINSGYYQYIGFTGGGFDEVRIQGDQGLTAFGPLNSSTFAIDDIAANQVPEPSTWAMMLIGFAALGFAAYRRKSKTATI
jgi:hypothetical protein